MLMKKLLLLLLFVAGVLSTLVCGVCESSVSATAKTLSFIIPDFVAI